MKKKGFLFFLALLLLAEPFLGLTPAASAAETDPWKNAIATAYDAYAAKLANANSANDALDQLLKPAIYGNGQTLNFDESEPIVSAIYNSHLFRAYLVECLPVMLKYMQRYNWKQAMAGGDVSWHDFALEYSMSAYEYSSTANIEDDVSCRKLIETTRCPGEPNRNDQALILVVGGSYVRIRITQTWASHSQIGYHLDITVSDNFDFQSTYANADKKGFNTTYSKLISLMGKLLKLKKYNWYASSAFDIVVPNLCSHTGSGNYRYEVVNVDLVNVTGEGLSANKATKAIRESATDTSPRYYYALAEKINLLWNQPWTIEFKMKTNGSLTLAAGEYLTDANLPFFRKLADNMLGIQQHLYRDISPTSGKPATLKNLHQYGVTYTDYGYEKSGVRTFRLENRIAEDGSNMVWLLIDGEEVAPMMQHSVYHSATNTTEILENNSGWFSGKNFQIQYIYNADHPYYTSTSLNYIEIRSGNSDPRHTVQTSVSEATCTKAAVETSTCMLCNGTWTKDLAPALGHTEEVIPGKAATCTEAGISEGKCCTVCGETLLEQEPLEVLAHSFGDWTTVTEAGCESDGQERRACTSCGHEETQTVAAAGHQTIVDNAVAATCTADGLTEGSHCERCGEVLTAQETVPATGHTEAVDAAVAASCTIDGLTEGTHCSACNATLVPQTAIPAIGHTWDEGMVTTEPTASEPGVKTYTCTVCGETKAEEIPAIETTILWGDVSGDGFVDSYDAALILKYDVMLIGDSDLNLAAADVSGDGWVDSYDASLILKYDVMLIEKFPVEN